jgi:hypothetical protein
MKPLNLDNSPCSPTSSNCIIWQGPDIPCIKLCKGDTISDVIFKLATELCTIMETLKVSNYDLECFNLVACPPSNFEELIQFLINKICELQVEVDATAVVTVTSGTPKSTSADTLVTVAPCFIVGTTTVMTVVEYATAMGTAICGIIDQIIIINNDIINLDIRVSALESTPAPVFTLPSFILGCNINTLTLGSTQSIDVVLEEFINNVWCSFYAATGSTTDLLGAVASQCIAANDLTKFNPANDYITEYPTWISTPVTVADSLYNIWLTLCDFYNASNVTITGADTSTIETIVVGGPTYTISSRIIDTGWVDLEGFAYYTGTMLSEKPQCRRIGNTVNFRGTVYCPLANTGVLINLSSPTAYRSVYTTDVYTGVGGVTFSAAGELVFNNNNSVIPTSILDLPTKFDNSYESANTFIIRRIEAGGGTGVLSAFAVATITSAKKLKLTPLAAAESDTTLDTYSLVGNSAFRYLTTNIGAGSFVPNYTLAPFGTLHGNTIPTYSTGGLLVIGQIYTITDYQAGDDFTNIGAVSNAIGQTFIATGTTPTAWTNFSTVMAAYLGSSSFIDGLGATIPWPLAIDAADGAQLGGFMFSLDGLSAYLDPCTTDLKSNICP